MITIRPFAGLGHADHGWLNARHHWSRPSRWCNFGCGRGPSSGGFGGDV
ncbi:MAG: hypothetical protein IPI83_02675 [Sphingomonadales bacterium]|nr:hypothetical protein [Sphingomonadales bacterium]